MARVLLISCNVTREPYSVYPLGMSMVASAARARGHSVMERDLLANGISLDWAPELIRSFRPHVIGLSLRNIDNIDSIDLVSYADSYTDVTAELQSLSNSPIVLGGAAYSLFPAALLERIGADYGVVGEGERAFCRLVGRIEAGRPPAQRIVRGGSPLRGDQINGGQRDGDLAQFHLKTAGMLNVQTKRGCPLRCAYCTYPLLEGSTYRFRSASEVVDEIQMLVERYGTDYYAIADSVFNDASGRYLGICEELVRRGISVPWMAFLRPQRFRAEDVRLLKHAGLHSVEWGTDCSTDATLRGMGKGFTWAEVQESNRVFAEAGVNNAHFVIFGGPGETEQTLSEGLTNIERLTDCVVFAYCGVRILPGTPIHEMAIRDGQVAEGDDLIQARFYFSPHVSQTTVVDAVRSSFDQREDRIYSSGKQQERVDAFHRLGYRGPTWDLLLRRGNRRRRSSRRTETPSTEASSELAG